MDEALQEKQTEQNISTGAQPEAAAEREETISKETYDRKVSEMNKTIKELKAKVDEKMTAEEKSAAEHSEMQQALKEARDEIVQLRAESALTAAGISAASSRKLSNAIITANCEDIVAAIKDTAAEIAKDTEARVKRELLEQSAPKIGIDGAPSKSDKHMGIVKKRFPPEKKHLNPNG